MNPTKEEIERALSVAEANNGAFNFGIHKHLSILAAAYREAIKERDEARDIARAFQKREWGMND